MSARGAFSFNEGGFSGVAARNATEVCPINRRDSLGYIFPNQHDDGTRLWTRALFRLDSAYSSLRLLGGLREHQITLNPDPQNSQLFAHAHYSIAGSILVKREIVLESVYQFFWEQISYSR